MGKEKVSINAFYHLKYMVQSKVHLLHPSKKVKCIYNSYQQHLFLPTNERQWWKSDKVCFSLSSKSLMSRCISTIVDASIIRYRVKLLLVTKTWLNIIINRSEIRNYELKRSECATLQSIVRINRSPSRSFV